MSNKKTIVIAGVLAVLIIATIVFGDSFYIRNKEKYKPAEKIPQPQETMATQLNSGDAEWETFYAKQEGFTLKYPADWLLREKDNTNCDGAACFGGFTITAPDGTFIKYVQGAKDETTDKSFCVQAACTGANVLGIEKIDVQNFKQVYMVKLSKVIRLHVPMSQETTPVIGKNYNSNFDIHFSLPSNDGNRYVMFLGGPYTSDEYTDEQFYNLDSVKTGMLVLKSLSYY